MATPLTDAITALTTYANTVTGASDTTLSDAVGTLAAGYGGGGGITTVASGTFTGNNDTSSVGAGRQEFSIGTKMAKTDFLVQISVPNETEFEYSSNRQFVWLVYVCYSDFGGFDISSNGNKSFVASSYHVNSNNSGTITQRTCGDMSKFGKQIYNGSIADVSPNIFQIRRYNDHFGLYVGLSNAAYRFPAKTYNYKVLYFGSNPSTDIIQIS